jgi:hypothetical protein
MLPLGASGHCRGAFRVRRLRGWRAEKRKILMGRALRHAGASRRAITAVAAPGPAFVRSVAHLRADRAVSQLLAGPPSGSGGSSTAARVPRCDEARGRRTPSRLRNASRERPLEGRGEHMIRAVFWAGISRASLPRGGGQMRPDLRGTRIGWRGRWGEKHTRPVFPRNAESHPPLKGRDGARCSGKTTHARHPGGSRDPGATRAEQAALDTGFRRYDGAYCLVGDCQIASPSGRGLFAAVLHERSSAEVAWRKG